MRFSRSHYTTAMNITRTRHYGHH